MNDYFLDINEEDCSRLVKVYRHKLQEAIKSSKKVKDKDEVLKDIFERDVIKTPEELDAWSRRIKLEVDKQTVILKQKTAKYINLLKPMLLNFIKGDGLTCKMAKNTRPRTDNRTM